MLGYNLIGGDDEGVTVEGPLTADVIAHQTLEYGITKRVTTLPTEEMLGLFRDEIDPGPLALGAFSERLLYDTS